jgi:hypothetical protein
MSDPNGPDDVCSLCHVKMSTGPCTHLIDLGEGRVGMPRSVWNELVADRLILRRIVAESGDGSTP